MKTVLTLFLTFILAVTAFSQEPPSANPTCIIRTSLGDIHVLLYAADAPETVENFLGLAEGRKEFTDPETGRKVKRPFYDGLIFHRVIENFMIQGGCPLGNGTGGPGYRFRDEINASALGLDRIRAFDSKTGPHAWLMIRDQEAFHARLVAPLISAMGIASQEEFEKRREELIEKLSSLTLKEAYENLGYRYDDSLTSHPPRKGVIAMANSGPDTNGSQFFITLADTPWLTGKHTVFGRVIKGMDVVEKIGRVEVDGQDRPLTDVTIISIRRTGS